VILIAVTALMSATAAALEKRISICGGNLNRTNVLVY
jgi:hypothetical protein